MQSEPHPYLHGDVIADPCLKSVACLLFLLCKRSLSSPAKHYIIIYWLPPTMPDKDMTLYFTKIYIRNVYAQIYNVSLHVSFVSVSRQLGIGVLKGIISREGCRWLRNKRSTDSLHTHLCCIPTQLHFLKCQHAMNTLSMHLFRFPWWI